MKTYDLYNPTRTPRIVYDGIEGSQKALKLAPGARLHNVPVADHVIEMLVSRRDDIQIYPKGDFVLPQPKVHVPKTAPVGPKPKIIVDGMYGIGDNLHQRAAIRELLKTHEVWLITCHAAIWHDMVGKGLHLHRKTTNLRTQAKILAREKDTFPDEPLPKGVPTIKIWYKKETMDKYGTIAGTLMAECGVEGRPIDFSMPVKEEWRESARKLIDAWKPTKPLMIYRPIVRRKEWNGGNRNPDPVAYEAIYKSIRDRFFVVSIADLKKDEEWIVGPEQEADIKIHDGSLHFETMAGLFAEADLVFCNAGMAPVVSQAVGTPSIVVYGGRECFRTTQAAGAHLAPTLGIDPITPCDCQSERHDCKKEIDIPAAIAKVQEFAKPRERTLIFATTYVDSEDRKKLTNHWLTLTRAKNPTADILIVDSASPIADWKNDLPKFNGTTVRLPLSVYDFGNNVGHLSRNGRDGWGRAFCFGLQAAVDLGYAYVAHIEGDSLLRTPVVEITRRMHQESKGVASIPVEGMKGANSYPTWVETGLMAFSTDWLKKSNFIEKYDWPNRKQSPTPEVVVRSLVDQDLLMLPLKGMRGDKNQITHQNIIDLNLDWVTHCHNDVWVYDRYIEHELGAKTESKVKINLGCGENRLKDWENHDVDVDISKPLPYPDNHADFIFCEHCVEHIPYRDAVAFFKECHRVLKPGGVVRITVPSIEQVYKNSDPEYWKFSTKFGNENSLRGAMNNILFKHGHQTAWTASLMEATLFYAGFDNPVHCLTHKSLHPELNDVEGHHHIIGEKFNTIESLSFEGTKGGEVKIESWPATGRVAIVVGGGPNVLSELDQAKTMYGSDADVFLINDMIPRYDGDAIGITLHPNKLAQWIKERGDKPKLSQIWAHRPFVGVTNHIEDWGGSSGLFAVRVARQLGYERIVLCGVPMTNEAHFVRNTPWVSVEAFKRGWIRHKAEIAPYVRSFSGWTAEEFGRPA